MSEAFHSMSQQDIQCDGEKDYRPEETKSGPEAEEAGRQWGKETEA